MNHPTEVFIIAVKVPDRLPGAEKACNDRLFFCPEDALAELLHEEKNLQECGCAYSAYSVYRCLISVENEVQRKDV